MSESVDLVEMLKNMMRHIKASGDDLQMMMADPASGLSEANRFAEEEGWPIFIRHWLKVWSDHLLSCDACMAFILIIIKEVAEE